MGLARARDASPGSRAAASRSIATRFDLPDPLKSLGTYKVAIKVYPGMTPEVTIVVEPKG